ncbi:MAG: L-rhamnose/proton symporter RhaT [Pseudomonadales bacterium]
MGDLTTGVGFALLAGLMLGLYALPQKYVKNFSEENTWGLFFLLTMFVVPLIATFGIMSGIAQVFSTLSPKTLTIIVVSSFLWGTGVMMWGKAIHHIGVSLGFSLFIGTVILVGSLLPFFVDGVPEGPAFSAIIIGLLFMLAGIIANGRAGMLRERDEQASGEAGGAVTSMAKGISIAISGGLLATGFSLANAVGRPPLHEASLAQGNPEWVTALAVMFPIFLSGGVVMTLYFAWQLTSNKSWANFKTPDLGKNISLIAVMAFFHYAASAVFAYAAFNLGAAGNTVGYAIFNTACVVTAIVSGLLTGEWRQASAKAKNTLYAGLVCMVMGVLVISLANTL